jgi:hypothetical protein
MVGVALFCPEYGSTNRNGWDLKASADLADKRLGILGVGDNRTAYRARKGGVWKFSRLPTRISGELRFAID